MDDFIFWHGKNPVPVSVQRRVKLTYSFKGAIRARRPVVQLIRSYFHIAGNDSVSRFFVQLAHMLYQQTKFVFADGLRIFSQTSVLIEARGNNGRISPL